MASTRTGQSGTVETNRLAAIVNDAVSVSTQAPGVMTSSAARAGLYACSAVVRLRTWATVSTAITTSARPAPVYRARRAHLVARTPAIGGANVMARKGTRKAV